jgi:hypothetical protein
MKRRVLFTLALAGTSVLLAGCLNLSQPRVTTEHRQLKNRAAVVVLVDARPRLDRIALQPTRSTHGKAVVAGWDARTVIGPYLAQRLQGMGLTVVPFAYAPAEYAAVYASSQAYPNPTPVRERIRALASAQQVDMVVTVYRQLARDYVGESIENLVGYGLVQHEGGGTQAYACVRVEAYDVRSDGVIGYADGCRSGALPPDIWQAAWTSDGLVTIDEPAATTVAAAMSDALQAAVLTAAQEAGLSH